MCNRSRGFSEFCTLEENFPVSLSLKRAQSATAALRHMLPLFICVFFLATLVLPRFYLEVSGLFVCLFFCKDDVVILGDQVLMAGDGVFFCEIYEIFHYESMNR